MKKKLVRTILLATLVCVGSLMGCVDNTTGDNVVIDKNEDFADNGFIPGPYSGNFTDQNGNTRGISVTLSASTATITCPGGYTALPTITSGHKLKSGETVTVTRDILVSALDVGYLEITSGNATGNPSARVLDIGDTSSDFDWDSNVITAICAPSFDPSDGTTLINWTNTQPA